MLGTTKKEYESQSAAFAGVRFSISGFDPLNAHKVRAKLIEGGGIDVGQYCPNCTHVIVHKIVYDDPICLAARSDGKTLVTGLWVDHSYDIGMPVDPTAIMYRPLRDLNGIPGAKSLTVCLTGYQRQDRDDIMTMVGLMGAQFSKPLVASKITHLVCYKFEGEKYELAKKITKIKLVNHRWLEDCLSAWEILPESNYVKSGHEMEMDAEAKDSDEDVANDNNNQQNSELMIGGSHTTYTGTLRTKSSPLSKKDVSRTITPTRTVSSLSKQDVSRTITPTRTNLSPLSKQDISRTITPTRTHPSPQSKQDVSRTITPTRSVSSLSKQDVSRTITPTRTNLSPLSKQDVSRTITPTRTHLSPQSKQDVSRTITPTRIHSSPQSKQDVSRAVTPPRTNRSPLSKQEVSRTITSIRTNRSPQSKQDVSRTVIPVSDNKRVINAQKVNSTILAAGEDLSNNTSPSQLIQSKEPVILSPRASTLKSNVNQDVTFMSSIEAFNKSPTSNNAQKSSSGCSKKSLNNSSNDELYHEETETRILPKMRTVDVPCNSSKLNKTSQNLKECIFEPPLQCHFGELGPEDNHEGSLMTNSSVFSMNKAHLTRTRVSSNPEHTPNTRSPMLDSSLSSKIPRIPQPPSGNVSLFNEELGNKLPSTSGSGMLKDSLNTELPKYGNADSLSKPRKEVLVKKCVGSRSKFTPYNTENQKGSLHSSRGIVQSSSSVVEEEMSKKYSCGVETNVAEINGDDAENASLDDETEAPDMIEENEIAVVEVQEKYWVEPAADLVKVANEDVTLLQNQHRISKVEAAKSKKRPLGKMLNKPVHSLPKTKKPKDDSYEKIAKSEKKDETIEKVKVQCSNPFRKKPKDDSHNKMIEKVKVKRPSAASNSNASRKKPKGDVHDKMEESEKNNEKIEKVKVERPNASRKKPKDDNHDKMVQCEKKDEAIEKVKVKPPKTSRKEKSVPAKVLECLTVVDKENMPIVGNKNISENLQQVGEGTPKLNETTSFVAAKNEATCFILAGHRLQRKVFKQIIKRLKGKLCKDSHQWSYQATHFIVPDPLRRTEKFFAAAASGRWILKTDYLTASNEAGRFLEEKVYEWHKKGVSEDGAINMEAPRKWRLLRERTGHGAFYGMRIIIYGECIAPSLETLKRTIKAGDGVILATSPPYNRFLKSGVDFAVICPGMPRVDIWVQEFISHEIPCIAADYLVEYVCKPGYSLDRHVQYNTQVWAERSLKRLAMMSEERVEVEVEEEPRTPECEDDLACQVCGGCDRGEEMLICGDEMETVGCGVGMHLDCCDPPLESVPKDDWFCVSCCKTVSVGKRKKKGK